ncbi:MAG: hypothetical protein ACYDDS_11795 [Candidatus Sulfotelmatobacter sp.]|jgi:hypothetical protein
MHNPWPVMRLAWTAAIVVYLVLIIVPGRMRPWEKRMCDGLFIAVVVFVGIREFGRYVFHGGLIFQFALVFAGFAAAIGIPLRIRAVIARYATDSKGGADEVKLKADS